MVQEKYFLEYIKTKHKNKKENVTKSILSEEELAITTYWIRRKEHLKTMVAFDRELSIFLQNTPNFLYAKKIATWSDKTLRWREECALFKREEGDLVLSSIFDVNSSNPKIRIQTAYMKNNDTVQHILREKEINDEMKKYRMIFKEALLGLNRYRLLSLTGVLEISNF